MLLGVGVARLDVLATAPPPAFPALVVVDLVEVEVEARERPAVFDGVCEEPDVPPPV